MKLTRAYVTTSISLLAIAGLVSITTSACVVKGEAGAGGTGPMAPMPGPAGSTTAETGPGVEVSPGCEFPTNHCLPADVLIVSQKAFDKGFVYAHPARQMGQPGPTGEATYLALNNGKEIVTAHAYATRVMAPSDIAVGRLVVMFHAQDAGFYRKPKNTAEATGRRWWIARITNVMGLSQGYVQVSGGYKVQSDNLRSIDGDQSPAVALSGAEDHQFVRADHWIVANKPLPEKNYIQASVGVAVALPSPETKNQGHFIRVNNGKILWTQHAWRTRPATEADLQIGRYAFMPHTQKDKVYQIGKDRAATIGRRWWIAKITDTSEAFKGVITVSGGYKVALTSMRVAQ